jgi:hypothetical protein
MKTVWMLRISWKCQPLRVDLICGRLWVGGMAHSGIGTNRILSKIPRLVFW